MFTENPAKYFHFYLPMRKTGKNTPAGMGRATATEVMRNYRGKIDADISPCETTPIISPLPPPDTM